MINIPSFKGIDFERQPYEELIEDIKQIDGFELHELEPSAGGDPIYGFSIGDLENKPVQYMHGHIHKTHEYRAAHWTAHFMMLLASPETVSPAHVSLVNYLKSKYSFYIIPVASPDDYRGIYGNSNANNVDITENFDWNWENTPYGTENKNKGPYPWSESEARNVRDVILQYKPVSHLCQHTWGGFSGYMTRRPQQKWYQELSDDFFRSVGLTSKLREGTDAAYGIELEVASSYNWAGTQESSQGRKIIANVFEVGEQETNIDKSRIGVNGLLLHAIHVDNYLTNNALVVNNNQPENPNY